MSTNVQVAGVTLAVVLIFVSGLLLWRWGKPYNTALITLHKLAGLGAGVLLVIIVRQAHQASPLGPAGVMAVAATLLLFVVTVAAGGLLSVDRPAPALVRRLHQVVPVLAVLSTAGLLVLLLGGT
jgi:hypothetical protein